MAYMNDFEKALRTELLTLDLDNQDATNDFVKWVKAKVFDSYNNGLTAKVETRNAVRNTMSRKARDNN